MTNIAGWVSFREIIDSQSLAEGDASDVGQFMRKLNFAIKAYEDLRLRRLPATTSVPLPIDSELRVVVLPNDCLKVVSVGMMSAGVFIPFSPTSDMVKGVTKDCGIDTQEQINYTVTPPYTKCYYVVEMENRRIVIDAPANVTQVMLNYTPTGVRMDGMTFIPRMCRGVIESFIDWQMVLRDKGVSMSEKKNLEMEYYRQCAMFQGLQYNVDELFAEYYTHILTGKQF